MHLALTSLCLDRARRDRRRRGNALERGQHWHRTAALYRQACRCSPAWAIRSCPAMRPLEAIVEAGADAGLAVGARCLRSWRPMLRRRPRSAWRLGLASRRRPPPAWSPVSTSLGENAALLALGATALHAISPPDSADANFANAIAEGRFDHRPRRARAACWRALRCFRAACRPSVWEKNPVRTGGAQGYEVLSPEDDARRDYQRHIRRQRRCRNSRSRDPAAGAARRDHSRGLLRNAELSLFLPPFMREARIPHRRAMARRRSGETIRL